VAWETAGWAFGTFVVNSGNYTAIYSGFAILIMFMIWLFVSWLILLLGTSIAFYCQYPGHLAVRRNQQALSPQMTEKLSLLAMFYIGRHYYRRQHAWKIDDLARMLGAPIQVVDDILNRLRDRKLIVATDDGAPPYVPAQDMETLPVKHILDAIRTDQESNELTPWRLPKEPAVDALLESADTAVDAAMQGQTLKDMVLAGTERKT